MFLGLSYNLRGQKNMSWLEKCPYCIVANQLWKCYRFREFTEMVHCMHVLLKNEYSYNVIILSDIDECANATTNNCDSNANCANTPGSFTCICNQGYIGDGTVCFGS